MSQVLINNETLQNIASAIRGKNGTSDLYYPSQMASAITDIPTGGGGTGVAKTVDLDMASGDQVITPDDDDTLLSQVTVVKPSTLTPENILSGVDIGGVVGTFEEWGTSLVEGTIVSVTANASRIRNYAFYLYSGLTTANFPACTTIGISAFNRCTGLTTANFPACTSIGGSAFYSCFRLTTASFPACTTIGISAFQYCAGLTTASFPACTSIGGSAFYSCSRLTTASFPACTSIGGSAFYNCYSLTTASFPACTSIGGSAFYNCYRLLSFYLLTSSVCRLTNTAVFFSTPISNNTRYTSGVYGSIFVRASLLDAYKASTYWSAYSSRFVGLTDEEIEQLTI